VGISI